MSPEAVGLAVLLHLTAAAAIWWLAVNRPTLVPQEDPVEILFEKPKPPDPPPPPKPPQQAPQPTPPIGLRPPAEITADKPTQVRPSGEAPKDIAGPPPRSLEDELPKQPPEPPPPAPSETALAAPTAPAPTPPQPPIGPRPPLFSAPPLATVTPAPPLHSTPPPTVTRPPQSRPTPPPPAMTPHPQPHPSPLVSRPQEHPSATARREEPQSSSPFVNPADTYNRATAGTNYLWQVIRKLRGYRYQTHAPVGENLTVVQIVIARDGRLLDVHVTQSSGIAEVDQGVLIGVRQGSPYTPLPAEIAGDRASFTLPLVSVPIR